MTSVRANRDSAPRPPRVDPAPLRSAFRAAMDGTGVQEAAPTGIEVQQRLVLKALVEAFGGEVTGSALNRYLSRRYGRMSPALGPRLNDVLQTLARSGAVSLEANGRNDIIVRLLPAGADV